jgi:exo-beta-1,3-glucanase (GH17 family)
MKAGFLVAAAAIASGVSAKARRHNHEAFHMERGLLLTTGTPSEPTCGCTTVYTTITGEGTLYIPPPPATTTVATTAPATTSPATVPTPFVTTCPTPGVYTIPATTITITEETTVCAATSTTATSGTNTAGGVTTVVETSTTVVCPYATVSTSSGVVTTTILTTTYVCPTPGTYTIAPQTTVCEVETIWVYPTVTSYPAGTYTQSEVIETVTETDYVIFCPYTSPAPALPVSTSPAAPAPPAPPATSTSNNGGKLGNSGKKWAITYSPYQNNGQCKDAGTVTSDIEAISAAGYTSVRVYSTDCSSLQNIGSACATYGLQMIIGVFINESGCSGAAEQVTEIVAWAQWDLVELIVIGNEAIFGGFTTASELAEFIVTSKSSFASAGYTGPCTTTEPLNIWQESVDVLCEVVDVVGCNIHAYFNGDVEPSGAGAFVSGQLDLVDGLCEGKYGINLETGWPSAGNCIGVSCPGPAEQLAALESLAESVGGKSVVLSFFDDEWKDNGDCACEQHWGISEIVTEF